MLSGKVKLTFLVDKQSFSLDDISPNEVPSQAEEQTPQLPTPMVTDRLPENDDCPAGGDSRLEYVRTLMIPGFENCGIPAVGRVCTRKYRAVEVVRVIPHEVDYDDLCERIVRLAKFVGTRSNYLYSVEYIFMRVLQSKLR